MKTEETTAEAKKIEPKNDVAEVKGVVAEELVEAEAKPQTEAVKMACGGKGWPRDPSTHGCDTSGILKG
ncbi:hypothetical protein SASPL_101871 [Salvia splendens]|uniref:Uncharacterized protein n=1 Tax=Salvia splendens TaxID=180675 RepID=A0A8X9AE18_SALSN|nr:hypothetical protein SASPL_101871 [Salvia splendens]